MSNNNLVFNKQQSSLLTCRAGTFNARFLQSTIKKQLLVRDFENYRLYFLGVTETWLKGCGVDSLENWHVLLRSGGQASRAGVGLVVHKRFSENVISCKFISDRIISVRVRTSPSPNSITLTIICCYAPTLQRSTAHPEEADLFYSSLTEAVNPAKRRDLLWLLGDFNAKVGSSSPVKMELLGASPNIFQLMRMESG